MDKPWRPVEHPSSKPLSHLRTRFKFEIPPHMSIWQEEFQEYLGESWEVVVANSR